MMMLEDDDYNESIQNIIDTQKVNAEYAVSITADNFAEMFSAMDDAYMQHVRLTCGTSPTASLPI